MKIGRRARKARFYLKSDDTLEGILVGRTRDEYVLEVAEAVTAPGRATSLSGTTRIPKTNVRFYTSERS